MNAHDDFMAKYEHHKDLLRQANLANKAAVFDALQAAEIASVQVEFDGVGDSGQIDDITASRQCRCHCATMARVTLRQSAFGASELSDVTHRSPRSNRNTLLRLSRTRAWRLGE